MEGIKSNTVIVPDTRWLYDFGVVKSQPNLNEIQPNEYTEVLLSCYNAFMAKYAKLHSGFGEILANIIPLKYIYDPDWISLFLNKDTLFFRLRDKDNAIISDLNILRKIIRECEPKEEVYYNALGVYYRDGVFCCLYFRYHERLHQRTAILRKQEKGKTTITFL